MTLRHVAGMLLNYTILCRQMQVNNTAECSTLFITVDSFSGSRAAKTQKPPIPCQPVSALLSANKWLFKLTHVVRKRNYSTVS